VADFTKVGQKIEWNQWDDTFLNNINIYIMRVYYVCESHVNHPPYLRKVDKFVQRMNKCSVLPFSRGSVREIWEGGERRDALARLITARSNCDDDE